MRVDVRHLESRLVEYLQLAKTGKIVFITDGDEVIAELRPGRRQALHGSPLESQLQALADAGEITRPSLPKGDWTWKVKGLGLPAGTAAQLLDDVRAVPSAQ